MKILLLGEFSALHKNLKEGLQELGHNVVIAASKDGFKNIKPDICFDSNIPGVLGRTHGKLSHLFSLPKLKDFDVVQIMNPFIFYNPHYPYRVLAHFFYNKIKKHNKKLFMLAAGDDAFYWKYGRQRLKYSPHEDFLKYDLKSTHYYLENEKSFSFNDKIAKIVDGIIPIMYEYESCYSSMPNKLKTIPIPINTKKIQNQENTVKDKIIVFHGLNRYGFKGTRHVEKAFELLSTKYPNDLELIIDGKMPLNDYLALMSRTNVVIDQLNSYSLGVNGVYAMALGKVVMGGAEPESLSSLNVDNSPVINLKPSADDIILAVESLLENKNSIQEIGYRSRKFAERVHGHINIANDYVNTWNNNGQELQRGSFT